ncbi:uncharacterized protein [Paramisgurnus dabryanus]|uniref:uncharacterized protein isoform X2 n=1 Tax=Paramisgurnus dabryanus TaxID=90735 RepID=UPI003CCFB85E
MSDLKDLETSRGGILRKQNSAPSGSRVTFARPQAEPDVELSHSVGRWTESMSTRPAQGPKGWYVRDTYRELAYAPPSYYPKMFILLGKADEDEGVPAGVRQKKLTSTERLRISMTKMEATRRARLYSGLEAQLLIPQRLRDMLASIADERDKITGSSAEGLVSLVESSGERDDQRKLCVSAPAAFEMLAVPPGIVNDDELVPAAGRQTDMSTPAQGQEVTSCGERDSQRRLCVSAPAVCETRFVLPGAIDDEEWVPAVVSTPAAALDEEERSLPVGRQIGRGAFSKVDEGTRKSDGMKSGKEIYTKIPSNPRTLRQTDPVPAAVEVNTPLIYWPSFNMMPSRCLTNDHRRNLFNLLIRLQISPKGFFPPRTFFPPCKKIWEVFLLGGFFNPGSQPTLALHSILFYTLHY